MVFAGRCPIIKHLLVLNLQKENTLFMTESGLTSFPSNTHKSSVGASFLINSPSVLSMREHECQRSDKTTEIKDPEFLSDITEQSYPFD